MFSKNTGGYRKYDVVSQAIFYDCPLPANPQTISLGNFLKFDFERM